MELQKVEWTKSIAHVDKELNVETLDQTIHTIIISKHNCHNHTCNNIVYPKRNSEEIQTILIFRFKKLIHGCKTLRKNGERSKNLADITKWRQFSTEICSQS